MNTADRWEITVYGGEPQTFCSPETATEAMDTIPRYPVTAYVPIRWTFGLPGYRTIIQHSPPIRVRQYSIPLLDAGEVDDADTT